MRRITTQVLTSQTNFTKGLFSGLYHSLLLVYDIASVVGEPVRQGELGTVRVNYRGEDIINADIPFFSLLQRLKGGTQGNGAAFVPADSSARIIVLIPFYSFTNKINSLPVRPNDNVQVSLNWNNTNMDSGTVTIYGVHTNVPSQYQIRYLRQDVNLGAGTNRKEFQWANVETVYNVFSGEGNDVLTSLSNIQCVKDNKLITDASPLDSHNSMLIRNRKDALPNVSGLLANAMANILEIPYTGQNRIEESRGESFEIQYSTSDAFNMRQYVTPVQFNPEIKRVSEELLHVGLQ